jgi:hypothetical protein
MTIENFTTHLYGILLKVHTLVVCELVRVAIRFGLF